MRAWVYSLVLLGGWAGLAMAHGPERALHEVILDEPVDWGFEPAEFEDLLEHAVGASPDDALGVELKAYGPDGVLRPLEEYLPEPVELENKHGAELYHALPQSHPGLADGLLSGKAVYVSQCHGWIWSDALNRFAAQRPNLFDTVEDLHNVEAANQFLTAYLENAGAEVFTVKERDLNPKVAYALPGGEGYLESGDGFQEGPAGFGVRDSYAYGQNPFQEGSTRRFPADGGAVASWVPDVPEDGWYAVYVSWSQDGQNAQDAHYRIHHPGGAFSRRFDQTRHGSTWRYVDTLWLPQGPEGLKIELIGDSQQSDRWLSAGAVRIGGGEGVIARHGQTHGRPRWEEGAVLGTQYNGAPPSVYDAWGNGNGTDPASRSRWAAWEHGGEDAVYLSWHSNAGGGNARGTSTHIYGDQCNAGPPVTGSGSLGFAIQDELVSAFRSQWDPSWTDRGLRQNCFAEVNPGHNPHMPAALVELAFHDNAADVAYLKHPEFRRDAARAMYRGIARYFAERDGVEPVYLPEPPRDVVLRHDRDGRLVASWAPGPSGFPYGQAPDSYRVQTSSDGRSWGQGYSVDGTSTVLDAEPGDRVFVRVVAVNDGGHSFPSKVVGAWRSPDGYAPVLVVDAFDRLDKGLLDMEDVGHYLGEVVRMNLRTMNAGDLNVAHGRAISAAGWPFDSATAGGFDDLDLSDYSLVIWAAGQEADEHRTFTSAQQDRLRSFVEDGGAVWASGSEVLWDLDADASSRAFASEVLGATLQYDSAGTRRAVGVGMLAGIGSLDFGMDDGAPYPVFRPDTLSSTHEPIIRYGNGQLAGIVHEQGAFLGFPFDSIGSPAARAQVADLLLPTLVPDYVPPDWDALEDDELDGEGELAACGCVTPGPASSWLLVASLAWLVGRRRRTLA